jgi:hypothetical protein
MEKTKQNKLSKGCKISKKVILNVFTMAVMCCLFSVNAFAATGAVDTSSFISTACTVLKSVICLIGAGVGVWGIVNLLEGYGNDNPGAKSQGMKQLMSGLGLILLGIVLVPVLQSMMTGAVS